ncbi:NAD-dependent protein deacetylase [Enhygromyxa salina]|uniref:protein acetyllysine N-acetyltransferase n=2 Tax=Enhygromyxa salina TaxID=215803 RepID=A0A2S9XGH6_9BACT|nr:NAD-dependent protein deacetylase [Enhygromyxa salina]
MRGRHVVALTGAGCSTESGIPDYRGEGTLARARRPVRFEVYAADPVARARYWSRAVVGWPRFCAAPPNAGHRALARLERAGIVRAVITQNVDRLHQAAGTREVVELHGALAEVRCLACGALEGRAELQERLLGLNPGWLDHEAEIAPDGDADLETSLAEFHVAGCRRCAGVLKPNVVFFGEQVPAAIVERAYALVESAELLVVLGSSLTVFSGLRFVRRAEALGTPIAIVNVGPTRGDALASLKIEARLGELLPRLAERLA